VPIAFAKNMALSSSPQRRPNKFNSQPHPDYASSTQKQYPSSYLQLSTQFFFQLFYMFKLVVSSFVSFVTANSKDDDDYYYDETGVYSWRCSFG